MNDFRKLMENFEATLGENESLTFDDAVGNLVGGMQEFISAADEANDNDMLYAIQANDLPTLINTIHDMLIERTGTGSDDDTGMDYGHL